MDDNCCSKDMKTLLSKRKIHLDDVFKEYIGEGEKYQIFLVVILTFSAFCSFAMFGDIIWVTDIKPHWCALPNDTNPALYNLSLDERLNRTVPWIEKDDEWINDSCNMYNLNYSSSQILDGNSFSGKIGLIECSSWEFDTSEMKNTIVEKVSK